MNDEVKKAGQLTQQDLEDAVNKALANHGAPNQMYFDPSIVQAMQTIFTSKDMLHPVHQRLRSRLHGMLKPGKIDWHTADIFEAAAKAFSNMGVFRHAPRE